MTALPTTGHVQAFLRVHAETSAYDAAHAAEADQEQLGQRYSLWQSCIDHLELLEANPEYASHFADLVMRHTVATAHAGDPAAYRAALDELGLGDRRFDEAPIDDAAPGPSPEALETGRKIAHVTALVGRIRPRVRHLPVSWWDIEETRASVLIDVVDSLEVRAVLDSLCRLLGLAFQVTPHSPGKVKVAAEGVIDGVNVSFWRLVAADAPGVDPEFRFAPGARPTIPRPGRDACAEATRAFKLATRLQGQVPAGCIWFVHRDIDVMFRDNGDIAAMRAELAAIAARFGLDYTDTPRPDYSLTARTLVARGTVDGIPVEFWSICEDYAAAPPPADDGALVDSAADVDAERAIQAEVDAVLAEADAEENDQYEEMTIHDVMSADEIFEHDQACEAAGDYAASLGDGAEL